MLSLIMMLVFFGTGSGNTTVFRALDANGDPFPDVLIIIKSLEGKGEIARYLTDKNGRTPLVKLDDGVYRVIATCPYGVCGTVIREVLGSGVPSELTLDIPVTSSDINGELIGAPRIRLVFETPTGKAAGAYILIRNQLATWEKWYTADEAGGVEVELPSEPSVAVVVYRGKIYRHQVNIPSTQQGQANSPGDLHRSKPSQRITIQLQSSSMKD